MHQIAIGEVILNWNWDHLRYFLALANAGSLSQAARDIGVSHTTVLRRVRAFEKELETHLFDHTAQGHKLTQAGESLYVEAQKMQAAVSDISRKISGIDQQIEGPVSITTTDTLGHYVLPPVITRLHQRYPQLSITLIASNRMSDIDNREADIALRTCTEPPPNLVGRKVCAFNFSACAARTYVDRHRLTVFPEKPDGLNFVVLDDRFSDTPFYKWLDSRLNKHCGRITANGMLPVSRLCAAGAGIALLPDYLVRRNAELIELAVDSAIATNDLWLLSHIDLRDTTRIRLVKSVLFEELTRELG